MNLIEPAFISRAGLPLPFKWECDAISDESWRNLAEGIGRKLPPFGKVVGVPRGGIPLAKYLDRFVSFGNTSLLICEDVWTTGGSWHAEAKKHEEDWVHIIGLVWLARNPPPSYIYTINNQSEWVDG